MNSNDHIFNYVWKVFLPVEEKVLAQITIEDDLSYSDSNELRPQASDLLPEMLQWAVTSAYDYLYQQESVQRIDVLHNGINNLAISVIATGKNVDFLPLADRFSEIPVEISRYQYAQNESQLIDLHGVMPWQEEIFRLCRRVMQIHNSFLDQLDIPLKKNEFVICRAVYFYPNSDQGTLVNITSIDKATLTLTVQDLRDKGFIEQIINPKDHRKRLLTLTDSGKAAYRECRLRTKVLPKILWDGIPYSHYATMLSVLEDMCARWDTYDHKNFPT